MRFPFALTLKIAAHIIKHKLRRTPKFALVLQLEPLHTCNLTCTGCGRIREYSTSLKDVLSLEQCLESARECEAPMVSVCGGEPLIYPKIEELVAELLRQGRIVYICTNGLLMRRKLRDYLASVYQPSKESLLASLKDQQLVSDKEVEEIRKGKIGSRPVIAPSRWLYWNVHVDGLERTHDMIVERQGVFRECVAAIKMAKLLGFQVATNTTVYKETDMGEIEQMFAYFSALGVDGHTISPGYDYDAAKRDMINRLGKRPEDFFLTREMTVRKFSRILDWGKKYTIFGTPVYQEFLAGIRQLTCTAWAIPTRNIKGWKAPCYLITDGHYSRYQEMLTGVNWEKYGVVDGKARDPRCENCMVHCGYDPSGALGTNYQRGDTWKNIRYNFGARPRRDPSALSIVRDGGISSDDGTLERSQTAEDTTGTPAARPQSLCYQNQDGNAPRYSTASGCSSGVNSQVKTGSNSRVDRDET
jgi:MoaA/NifB/PqqE/SkfB family radical SAM enzyme